MDLAMALGVQLAIRVPEIILWITGIVLAMARRREHPRGYLLAAVAFGIFLILSIVSTSTSVAVPILLIQGGAEANEVGTTLAALSIIYTLVSTGAWALLLIALFSRRPDGSTILG